MEEEGDRLHQAGVRRANIRWEDGWEGRGRMGPDHALLLLTIWILACRRKGEEDCEKGGGVRGGKGGGGGGVVV